MASDGPERQYRKAAILKLLMKAKKARTMQLS
jgi:hypothetical protein